MKSIDLLGGLNKRLTNRLTPLRRSQGWVHRYQHLFSRPKWPSSRKLHKLHVSAAVKTTSRKQVACSRTLIAKPGQEEALEALCKEIVSFSKARMADTKTGLVAFECSKDMFEPNTYHFWEVYESNLALGKHSTLPELKQFMEKTNDMLVGPIGMALYEYKDGKLGAVSVQGGPKGEGGLDDATGASGAAGGASYKQTSSTVDLTSIKEDDDDDKGLWGIKFKLPWMK
jgi:quinol monooxygenase YgiN